MDEEETQRVRVRVINNINCIFWLAAFGYASRCLWRTKLKLISDQSFLRLVTMQSLDDVCILVCVLALFAAFIWMQRKWNKVVFDQTLLDHHVSDNTVNNSTDTFYDDDTDRRPIWYYASISFCLIVYWDLQARTGAPLHWTAWTPVFYATEYSDLTRNCTDKYHSILLDYNMCQTVRHPGWSKAFSSLL